MDPEVLFYPVLTLSRIPSTSTPTGPLRLYPGFAFSESTFVLSTLILVCITPLAANPLSTHCPHANEALFNL